MFDLIGRITDFQNRVVLHNFGPNLPQYYGKLESPVKLLDFYHSFSPVPPLSSHRGTGFRRSPWLSEPRGMACGAGVLTCGNAPATLARLTKSHETDCKIRLLANPVNFQGIWVLTGPLWSTRLTNKLWYQEDSMTDHLDDIPEDMELSPEEQEKRKMAFLKAECDLSGKPYPSELRDYIGRMRGIIPS